MAPYNYELFRIKMFRLIIGVLSNLQLI